MEDILHYYKVGQPDASSGDIWRLLYEAIVLISLLRPSSGNSKVFRTPWQRFLDDLSSLCDTESGGRTVTSIAVERLPHSLRFWIAANDHVKPRALALLVQILAELRTLALTPCLSTNDVEARIFNGAIYDSHERVGDYVRKLRMNIRMAAKQSKPGFYGWCNATISHIERTNTILVDA